MGSALNPYDQDNLAFIFGKGGLILYKKIINLWP